ncbi:MAG: hypothetical protein HWE39_12870 [Oceanospirillaceae bacterium]|nr:hypothetical protein [Oceanospirillaceae bacterium]
MNQHIPFDESQLLLGYQKRWLADESSLKIAEKSRRTGLTWAEAADAVLTASLSKSDGGTNHFYVGSNKEMAREFIDAVAMWAKAFDKACGEIQEEVFIDEDKDILTFVVHFASGFKVQALSSNPKNLRGMQGNVTIDEAGFHERLAEVLKAALALTMWGAKVRLISTHNGDENLFNQLINDARAGKNKYSIHRITLDDACAEGLYKRICQTRKIEWTQEKEGEWKDDLLKATASEEDALEEYYCVPKQGGGSYLSRALIESRMKDMPVIRFEGSSEFNSWPEHLRVAEVKDWCEQNLLPVLLDLNPKEHHVFGEDFARSGDLTVIAPVAIKQNLHRRIPFIVELKNVPFKNQEQILFYIGDRLPRLLAGALDARGNGQYLAEQAKYEYGSGRIEEVMLSQAWYLDNMPRMKAAFEDGSISIPKDADILSDLTAIKVIKGIARVPEGNTSDDKKKQRHGDAAIAIALALYAAQMDVEVFEYHSAKKQQTKDQDAPSRSVKVTGGFRRGCL